MDSLVMDNKGDKNDEVMDNKGMDSICYYITSHHHIENR